VTRLLDAAEGLALRVDPRRWALAIGGAIVFLGVMGILRFAHKDTLRPFNLDGERNVPAAFSGLLWLVVALLAYLAGRAHGGRALAWKALAALFVLLAVDEVAEVHEHLQYYAGIDWQLLYLPVGLLAGVAWIVVGRDLSRLGAGFWAFVGATVCGLVAQPLEALQIDSHANPRRGFRVMVVSEELLEMLAALLLTLAFGLALRSLRASETRRAA
jgi:hypothetical protein